MSAIENFMLPNHPTAY